MLLKNRIAAWTMKIFLRSLVFVAVWFSPLPVYGEDGAPTSDTPSDDDVDLRIVGGEDALRANFHGLPRLSRVHFVEPR